MVLDALDQHPIPTSEVTPAIHGREDTYDQGSESEEEMTYIGWEQLRTGHTVSKPAVQGKLGTPGPGARFFDQVLHDGHDDHDDQMSFGDSIHEDLNEAIDGSVAAADQKECKSVSHLLSTQSGLTNSGISGSFQPSRRRSRRQVSLCRHLLRHGRASPTTYRRDRH
jgi:hypothetical protein